MDREGWLWMTLTRLSALVGWDGEEVQSEQEREHSESTQAENVKRDDTNPAALLGDDRKQRFRPWKDRRDRGAGPAQALLALLHRCTCGGLPLFPQSCH